MRDISVKFKPTMKAHWQVWPSVNFINFLIVPIHYQVLFSNMVSLFFNSYLSYLHNSYKVDQKSGSKTYNESAGEVIPINSQAHILLRDANKISIIGPST